MGTQKRRPHHRRGSVLQQPRDDQSTLIMQRSTLIPGIGALVLLVSAAAFVAGRLLTQRMDAVRVGAPFEGDFRSMLVPAPELPVAPPDVTGAFIERQDNLITVEIK